MITEREARLLRIVQVLRVMDASGHAHDSQGKFTSGSGGGSFASLHELFVGKLHKLKHKQAKEMHRAREREKKALHKYIKETNLWASGKYDALVHSFNQKYGGYAKGGKERWQKEVDEPMERFKKEIVSARKQERERGESRLEELSDLHWGQRKELLEAYHRRKSKLGRSLDSEVNRALSPHRIGKASSAESILRHCLRVRGWTVAYRNGELTGPQHVDLLEEIRQYGRDWLRHEAEQFAKHYLARSVEGNGDWIERKLVWTEEPGTGFLIAQETGFFSNLGRFFKRAKQFVRELIVGATLGLTGPSPLTGEELDAAEREAQKQEQFFDRFHDETKLAPQPMTAGQFVARVEKYGDSAWQAAQRINHNAAVTQGRAKLERRVLGQPKTEHCSDCPEFAGLGWQPIGTLPHIGESECGPLCLCHFEYKDSLTGQPFLQGKRGPVPAPQPGIEMIGEHEAGEVEMIAEPTGQRPRVPIAGPPRSLSRTTDASGHAHVSSGPHGGEFTSKGGEGGASHKGKPSRHKRKPGESIEDYRKRMQEKRKKHGGTTTSGKKGVDTRVKLQRDPTASPKVKDEARAARAKLTEKRQTGDVQRYAEAQEEKVVKALGGRQGTDNGALDTVRHSGGKEQGMEVKCCVNKDSPNKIGKKAQMKCEKDQKARKEQWASEKEGRELHTIYFDHRDRAVNLETGEFIGAAHAFSGHEIYYRRGVGPYTMGGMHPANSWAEVDRLMNMPADQLPPKARAKQRGD